MKSKQGIGLAVWRSSGKTSRVRLILGMSVVASLAACSAPGGPDAFPAKPPGLASTPDEPPAPPAVSQELCVKARSHEQLKAHSEVLTSAGPMSKAKTMFTSTLFARFKGLCGACHVDGAQGNFNVNLGTFGTKVDEVSLARMRSDDPDRYMPTPAAGGKPYSQRSDLDPVRELATLLALWLEQGRPIDYFYLPESDEGDNVPYRMSQDAGESLTNIGNCVPTPNLVGKAAPAMNELDAAFAAATELPLTLDATDLTTFDSEELARNGVVAFAPTYPLFSDHAGKIRHVRVPRGQSIVFDKATQKFTIPPNTRFYKTFLKKVVEVDGRESWRKIETRLIVSRPDTVTPDGTAKTNSLFGTYVWDESTGKALLLRVGLNDGTGFADRLVKYVQDEGREKSIRDSNPPNLSYALEWEDPTVLRHYAIPGSFRCIECHMGAEAESSFILGFTPVQLRRRADGKGGTYEATGADELTQLQRLIDYGVITGMTSPEDVVLLEDSQGGRKPRNEYELKAQGYMIGNCSFCHNPRGFPSVKNSELKAALDFMPSATGGIFQFPLERYSPLRSRGAQGDIKIPYITPSLREYPVGQVRTENWLPKWVDCSDESAAGTFKFCEGSSSVVHLSAPWRSLIYRNVDTPFTYADDYVIFPHMPMHGSGHDCRAAKIMGDWMVSIPARLKQPATAEDAIRTEGAIVPNTDPQPYEEMLPSDPNYYNALTQSEARWNEWRNSARYKSCPDDSDIVDRKVLRQGPNDPLMPPDEAVYDPATLSPVLPPDKVPDRAHFVVTDLTEAPGDWGPRRADWNGVLFQKCNPDCKIVDGTGLNDDQVREQERLIPILQSVRLSPALRSYALTKVPFGLWQNKPACTYPNIPRVKDFVGDQRPDWMTQAKAPPDAAVFMQAPGHAVFDMICRNCHGPQADSKGLMAEVILSLTGGTARVANFRDGIFGPVATPGGNLARVFTPKVADGFAATVEERGALYLSWMALGGTQRRLPEAVLNIIAASPTLGLRRDSYHIVNEGSPNMLRLAQELCAQVLPVSKGVVTATLDDPFFDSARFDYGKQTALIGSIGDAEMWMKLCAIGNDPIVRVARAEFPGGGRAPELRLDRERSFYFGKNYPATAPVLDHNGRIATGVKADNFFPLCVSKPASATELATLDAYLGAHLVKGTKLPWCPGGFETAANQLKWERRGDTTVFVDADAWATRGAINAGMAVFLYLEEFLRQGAVVPPDYNQCEKLQ